MNRSSSKRSTGNRLKQFKLPNELNDCGPLAAFVQKLRPDRTSHAKELMERLDCSGSLTRYAGRSGLHNASEGSAKTAQELKQNRIA